MAALEIETIFYHTWELRLREVESEPRRASAGGRKRSSDLPNIRGMTGLSDRKTPMSLSALNLFDGVPDRFDPHDQR
ncbi:MAG: hypothetical protein WBQ81_04935, partial [Candidatus Sulfotelmatobacter sp.]